MSIINLPQKLQTNHLKETAQAAQNLEWALIRNHCNFSKPEVMTAQQGIEARQTKNHGNKIQMVVWQSLDGQ